MVGLTIRANVATGIFDQADEPEVFDFYISPTGSDSNNGLTTSTPWAITAINTKRATYAGLRVGLMDGTYDLSAMPNYAGDGANNPYPILQVAGGSASASTVIKAVNARAAILNLRSGAGVRNQRPAIGQYGTAIANGYIDIDGLRVTGGGFWGMSFWGAVATNNRVGWKPNVRVLNCQIDDLLLVANPPDNQPGIWFDKCTGPIVRNNLFFNISDGTGGYGPCAVMTLSVRGLIFEYNEVYDVNCPIHDKHNNGDDFASDGFVIRYNYFHDSGGAGQYLIIGLDTEYIANAPNDTYQESQIHNNLIVGWGGGWYCKGNSPTRMSVTFYNNTWVLDQNAENGFLGTMATTSDLFSFYNNLISRQGFTLGWSIGVSIGAFGTVDFNMYDSGTISFQLFNPINSTSWNGTTYSSLAAWRAATPADDNSTQGTAVFVGGSGPEAYALAEGSPGRDAGRVGGTSAGASRHVGAYDGVVTQIGPDW
jgi:hypothetical protein